MRIVQLNLNGKLSGADYPCHRTSQNKENGSPEAAAVYRG